MTKIKTCKSNFSLLYEYITKTKMKQVLKQAQHHHELFLKIKIRINVFIHNSFPLVQQIRKYNNKLNKIGKIYNI